MNQEQFKKVYEQVRNGANTFYRHPLVGRFAYSDGVRDLAKTGCWWLIDVLATEVTDLFRALDQHTLCIVTVDVACGKCSMRAEFEDDVPVWSREGIHTDLPDGRWLFYIAEEDGQTPFRCILPTEY